MKRVLGQYESSVSILIRSGSCSLSIVKYSQCAESHWLSAFLFFTGLTHFAVCMIASSQCVDPVLVSGISVVNLKLHRFCGGYGEDNKPKLITTRVS